MACLRFRLGSTLSAAVLVCFAAAMAGPADESGFNPIFNGKDLAGWKGDEDLWSVEDGAITGTTTNEKRLPYNKFLLWTGGTVKNFELRAKVKLVGNSNSGIQYRSKTLPNVGEFSVGGYQADIHPDPNNNAMLYDERGRGILATNGQKVIIDETGQKYLAGSTGPVKRVKLDEWNEYTVIAHGNHLIHQLNGSTTVDVIDHQASERELGGILALQLHVGPAMKVQFKDVLMKTLPDGGVLSPEAAPVPADAKKIGGPAPKAKAKADAPEKQAAAKETGTSLTAQDNQKTAAKKQAGRAVPTGPAPEATPVDKLKGLKDFKVELIHAVPRESEGSWVSMTLDPKGRLIVSDQYGGLFRVTPPPLGGSASETKVEPIKVDIGEAQGLLWAFDSLYVVVNRGQKYPSGLYRVRDTNNDDALDTVETLRKLEGGGEHGPHAVVLAPDGKSLYVVAGNATKLPELASSLVPKTYGEDNLLPRMTDGAGFMRDEKAPGGWVCRVDPDGKEWELVAMGFRNAYDIAFDRDGHLFTFDSDMEWDMNMPWYRPTRVCNVVSGGDFGYRNGAGKFPTYYLDSLPPVVDIGPGSPTGVAFGHGAKFPAKYQDALYICDWSYGKLYAVHLKPKGTSFSADVEEFLSGSPLPLTDLVVDPRYGAMYFAVGGRRTTSALYRISYAGPDSTRLVTEPKATSYSVRNALESFHGQRSPGALSVAWNALSDPDRFTGYAARVALEWQDPGQWRDRALSESDPNKAIPALLALIRVSASDPAHRSSSGQGPDEALRDRILDALDRVGWDRLSHDQKLDLTRDYQVLLNRFGKPDTTASARIVAKLDSSFPSKSRDLNVEIAQVLAFLEAPDVVSKTVSLLKKAPTQEEQIDFARTLRTVATGWTPELRKQYFSWFLQAANYRGGNSFRGFMKQIKDAAAANLSESEKVELKAILDAPLQTSAPPAALASRPFVKEWTLAELAPIVEKGLIGRDFDRGRTLFAATQCFACHRFNNEGGGAGPDLTAVSGRFNTRDLLESIVEPSKVISDQYAAVTISTTDGKVVTGRIVNLHNDVMHVNTNMLDPNLQVSVDQRKVDEMKPSPVSMMPEGLFNTLNKDEVLDVVAYLLSRGDRGGPTFARP